MVAQIVASDDKGVLFENSDELKEKMELQNSEIISGRRKHLWLIKKKGKNLFGSTHPVYRAIKRVIMRVKAQFAKRLCQPYHTTCQRSNQAIISCHKTLKIAFEVSEASSLGCNKLISAAKLDTKKFLLFTNAFFVAVILFSP